MSIRLATAADAGAVHALVHALAVYEKMEGEFSARPADFARLMADGTCAALLAEEGAGPIGIALFYPIVSTFVGRRSIWLEDLFVLPEHRGGGHGLALLKTLARHAVDDDFAGVEWNVLDWNTPAIGFYRRIGAEAREGWTDQRLSGAALQALAA